MKQRAGLALALLHSPKVLILDEPTNGLDPVGIKDLRNILKSLVKEHNIAVLVSSHILSEMEQMCDRVVVINNGKFVKTQSLNSVDNNIDETIRYEIKVKQLDKAKSVLKNVVKGKLEIENDKLIVVLKKDEISKIIKELVLNEVDVETVHESENTLENIFFDVTEEGNKNE